MTEQKKITTPLLIVGSGAAGYTAAIYAARANLKPVLIQGLQPGGQLTITTDVENYPGFKEPIQGPWLMEQMREQALAMGTKIISDVIVKLETNNQPFIAIGDSGSSYQAQSLIIATGASAKWLGLESEKKFRGFGVSACATCDGFFFRGKKVAVIGGGNSALEEALFLTNHASKVYLIHRRDNFRGEKVLQDRVFKNPKIEIIWNHVVDEILGEVNEKNIPQGVHALRLKNTQNNEVKTLAIDGVFIAIGHSPNTKIVEGHITIAKDGYIITEPGSTKTSKKGIFAAGDVADRTYRQAVTAAGMGCMAALDAEKYLASLELD